MKELGIWLRQAGIGWYKDNAMRMSSSLAYYTLLSLAPVLLLVVAIAGIFLGDEAARGHIAVQLTKRFGEDAATAIESIILYARDPEDSVIGTVIGLIILLWGASGVFGELQDAMNTIWQVAPKPGRGLKGVLRDRLTSFLMVLAVALLLLGSLLVGAVLVVFGTALDKILPVSNTLWQGLSFGFSFVAVTTLFALCFKLIPDVEIGFHDVWLGAILTAILFSIGELALAFYIGHSALASPYGAAGSLIVLVVWVYYSAQIMFYGAEFIKVRADARGIEVCPNAHAMRTRTMTPPSFGLVP